MILFFAYYSVDNGYRILYLGNSTDTEKERYHIPLLEYMRNHFDEYKEQLDYVEQLPKMGGVENYPPEGTHLYQNGGYSLIYRHIRDNSVALAINDIPGEKDTAGRPTTYPVILYGNSREDWSVMDRIVSQWLRNIDGVRKMLSKMLVYDSRSNGIRFDVAKCNTWLNELAVPKANDKQSISMRAQRAYIVPSNGVSLSRATSEQGISTFETIELHPTNISNENSSEKLEQEYNTKLQKLQKEHEKELNKLNLEWKKRYFKGIAIVITAMLLVTLVVSTCSRNQGKKKCETQNQHTEWISQTTPNSPLT